MVDNKVVHDMIFSALLCYLLFLVDATIMVTNKCPITDKQAMAFFVTQKAAIAIV